MKVESTRESVRALIGSNQTFPSALIMTRMQLPPELISHIVYFLVHDSQNETDQLGVNIKPPWSSVHGFSLASRTFRAIFLENWFQRLYITAWDDVTSKDILMFPDIFVWAKYATSSNI